VLKISVKEFTSLPCQTLWRNWLDFFQSLQMVYNWKKIQCPHYSEKSNLFAIKKKNS